MSGGDMGADAARRARSHLGVGQEAPLPDLLKLLEEGPDQIAVAVMTLPMNIACAYATKEDVPFIFLNGSYEVEDQRFALAHAYGHHVLGHGDTLDFADAFESPRDPKEREANRFAAEFLAPEAAVRHSVDRWQMSDPSTDPAGEALSRFAAYFGLGPLSALERFRATAGVPSPASPSDPSARTQLVTVARLRSERAATGEAAERSYAAYFPEQSVPQHWSPFQSAPDSLALAQEQLPRLPGRMQRNAVLVASRGLAPLGRLAAALRRNQSSTAAWLRSAGVEPPDADQVADQEAESPDVEGTSGGVEGASADPSVLALRPRR